MITAKVHGMPELRAKLMAMQAQATAAMKEATLAGAEVVREEASVLAPRRAQATKAGHMADHITAQLMRSTSPLHVRVRIGPDKAHWYGRFAETGTVKMAARPFLRPALDTKHQQALAEFKAVMQRKLGVGGLRSLR